MINFKHAVIAAAAITSLAAFGPAAAEKLAQDSAQAKCDPDLGPSIQYIDGREIHCNPQPAPTF